MNAAARKTARTCYGDGPSLLAADSEEEPSSDEGSDLEDSRPTLLPLNEVIRTVPNSLSDLLDVMVPRLQQRSGVKGISSDEQQSFVSILVGELSSRFSDLKQQIDDPFLSPKQNKSLHRLVVVQVCRIVEDLYAQYTAKAARLCDDGALSSVAHMSRLRAQLSVQANKSINLPAIRHQMLSQLRGPLPTSHQCRLPRVPQWQPPHTRAREKTDLDTLDLGAPLTSKLMVSSLGPGESAVLRRRRVEKLSAAMTPHGHTAPPQPFRTTADVVADLEASVAADLHSVTQPSSPDQIIKLERPPSMPELFGNFLLCDWKLLERTPYHIASPDDQRRERRHQALRTARRYSIGRSTAHDGLKWTSEQVKVETKLGDYTRDDLNSDLHQLSEVEPSFVHSVAQDDIDPLLQACVHGLSKRQKSRLAAHDLKIRMREEEEKRRRQEEEERKMREGEAIPTLEDMEKMQYLVTQAPQSYSHSHASLHVRSNASDWQTHSQAPSSQLLTSSTLCGLRDESSPDLLDQWSGRVGAQDALSQTSTVLSCSAVSGVDLSPCSQSGFSVSSVGSHLKQAQHSSVRSVSGHSAGFSSEQTPNDTASRQLQYYSGTLDGLNDESVPTALDQVFGGKALPQTSGSCTPVSGVDLSPSQSGFTMSSVGSVKSVRGHNADSASDHDLLQTPSQAPSLTSSQTPSQTPSQTSSQAPSHTPSQSTSSVSSQLNQDQQSGASHRALDSASEHESLHSDTLTASPGSLHHSSANSLNQDAGSRHRQHLSSHSAGSASEHGSTHTTTTLTDPQSSNQESTVYLNQGTGSQCCGSLPSTTSLMSHSQQQSSLSSTRELSPQEGSILLDSTHHLQQQHQPGSSGPSVSSRLSCSTTPGPQSRVSTGIPSSRNMPICDNTDLPGSSHDLGATDSDLARSSIATGCVGDDSGDQAFNERELAGLAGDGRNMLAPNRYVGSSRNLLAPDSVGLAGSSRNLLAADSVGLAGSSRNLLAPDSVGLAGSSRNLLASDSVGLAGSSRNLLAADSVGLAGSSRNLLASDSAVPKGENVILSGVSVRKTQGEGGSWKLGAEKSFSDMQSFSQATFSDLESHREEENVPEELGPQPQPAVITTTINGKVIRSSDLGVSERAPLTTLTLKPYGPIWNELTGELNRKTIDELDSNLSEGQEMDVLYHELMRTIPRDYLDMESEPSLIPAIPDSVDVAGVLASSSLPHRRSKRVTNPDLCPEQQPPPWGDKARREEWKNSNLYAGPDPKELMAPKGSTLTPAQARLRQQYLNWLKWWKSTVSSDDYLKFVAQKECDYLHHIYHLYDSEGSESEAEEEREKRERLVRLHSKLQAKHAKREEQYRKKTQYEHGMWNVNTILMGGLGGDPHSSGSSSDEDQLRELEQNKKEPEEGMQERFQGVWSRLHLSQQQSIEMAVKYSSHQYQQHIRTAIFLWEKVCALIEEREKKLDQLQTFEKSASDPSRLFTKGADGSSTTLLQEAKRRKRFHSVLDNIDRKLSRTLKKLKSRFGDVVMYKCRPYHEKMRRDRTELLYWLQQERRKTLLEPPTLSPSSPSSDSKNVK